MWAICKYDKYDNYKVCTWSRVHNLSKLGKPICYVAPNSHCVWTVGAAWQGEEEVCPTTSGITAQYAEKWQGTNFVGGRSGGRLLKTVAFERRRVFAVLRPGVWSVRLTLDGNLGQIGVHAVEIGPWRHARHCADEKIQQEAVQWGWASSCASYQYFFFLVDEWFKSPPYLADPCWSPHELPYSARWQGLKTVLAKAEPQAEVGCS